MGYYFRNLKNKYYVKSFLSKNLFMAVEIEKIGKTVGPPIFSGGNLLHGKNTFY